MGSIVSRRPSQHTTHKQNEITLTLEDGSNGINATNSSLTTRHSKLLSTVVNRKQADSGTIKKQQSTTTTLSSITNEATPEKNDHESPHRRNRITSPYRVSSLHRNRNDVDAQITLNHPTVDRKHIILDHHHRHHHPIQVETRTKSPLVVKRNMPLNLEISSDDDDSSKSSNHCRKNDAPFIDTTQNVKFKQSPNMDIKSTHVHTQNNLTFKQSPNVVVVDVKSTSTHEKILSKSKRNNNKMIHGENYYDISSDESEDDCFHSPLGYRQTTPHYMHNQNQIRRSCNDSNINENNLEQKSLTKTGKITERIPASKLRSNEEHSSVVCFSRNSSVQDSSSSSVSDDDDDETMDSLEEEEEDDDDVYDWLEYDTFEGLKHLSEKKKKDTENSCCKSNIPSTSPTVNVLRTNHNNPPSTLQLPSYFSPTSTPISPLKSVMLQPKNLTPNNNNVKLTPPISNTSSSMFTPPQTNTNTNTNSNINSNINININRLPSPSTLNNATLWNSTSYNHNHNNHMEHVKDTTKVKRKRANLPSKKPNAVLSGNWLTNRYTVNNYILLNPLGRGSYAEVRLCKEKKTNQLHAMKIMNKESLQKKSIGKHSTFMDDVKREVAIMKKLRHENVLRLYEVMDDPKVNKLYLVLEYMKRGDLFQITNGNPKTHQSDPLSEEQVWDIARQVLQGLKYLHDNNIVHGDIKPQNILVDDDGRVKIADFGISKMLGVVGEKQSDTVGTPAFMAPELCAGKVYDGKLADLYAVGATLFCLREGHPPFLRNDLSSTTTTTKNKLMDLYTRTQKDPVVFTLAVAEGLKRLIVRLMEKNPSLRLSMSKAIQDPWLQIRPNGNGQEFQTTSMVMDETSYSKVKVTEEDIFNSIHEINFVLEEEDIPNKIQSKTKDLLDIAETSSRISSFHRQANESRYDSPFTRRATIKKTDKNILDPTMDDVSEDMSEDGEDASILDDNQFDTLMDTLSQRMNANINSDENMTIRNEADFPTVNQIMKGLSNRFLKIKVAHQSEKGHRNNQEDRMTIIMNMNDLRKKALDASKHCLVSLAFFALYDGHGGARCADELQQRLHLELLNHPLFPDNLPLAIEQTFLAVDKMICDELRRDFDASGSTCLVACLTGGNKIPLKLILANVGDCKCVMNRDGLAISLTQDHRLSREDEMTRLQHKGVIVKDNRVNGILAVTRSFGDVHHCKDAIIANPEIMVFEITETDEFIVLATDGLWDVMGPQAVVNYAKERFLKCKDIELVTSSVIEEAMRRGSIDNVTVILIVTHNHDET